MNHRKPPPPLSAFTDITNSELRDQCRQKDLKCGPLTNSSMRKIWTKRLATKILDEFIADEQNEIEQLEEATTECSSYSEDEDFVPAAQPAPVQTSSVITQQPSKAAELEKVAENSPHQQVKSLISEIKEIGEEIQSMKNQTQGMMSQAEEIKQLNAQEENKSNTVKPGRVMFWSLVFVIIAALVQIFLTRRNAGLPQID